MKRTLTTVALGFALFASTSAFAYDGYVTGSVYLRAGPDSGYPTVARLRAGTSVVIEGCVDDWSWCDVYNHDDRGWVSANYLQHEYEGHRVLLPQYGVQIGIPIITFVFGSYWDDHYRSRSWYHDRDRYSHITPHYGHGGTSGGSQTYQAPSQAPAGQPRQSGTTTAQPTYQAKPSTTTAPQHPVETQTQTRTPEKSAPQQKPQKQQQQQQQPQQQQAQQQQAQQQQAQQQHKATAPTTSQKQAPAKSKSPPAQSGKEKGKDQSKDQGGGKDQSKDQGGGKDKDQGGGKDVTRPAQ